MSVAVLSRPKLAQLDPQMILYLPLWRKEHSYVPDIALDFDGIDDNVNCGNGASLQFVNASAITLEAWINVQGLGQSNGEDQVVLHKGGWATNFYKIERVDDSHIQFAVHFTTAGAKIAMNLNPIPKFQWHHIVGAYDGNNMIIYVNGVAGTPVSVPNDTLSGDTTYNLKVGIRSDYGNVQFNGLIDQVRIYNRSLSASEVAANYNLGRKYASSPVDRTGLVGEWHFSEGSGTIAKDSSGQGNTGTITGATWDNNSYTGMMSGDHNGHLSKKVGALWTPQGHYFDGTDDKLTVGNTTDFYLGTGDFTVITYAKKTALGTLKYLATKDDGTATSGIVVEVWESNVMRGWAGGSGAILGTTTIIAGLFYQFAISRLAGVVNLWLNAKSEGSATGAGNINTNRALRIGCYVDSVGTEEGFWNGVMAEVFIYSRGLSAVELNEHRLSAKRRMPWL